MATNLALDQELLDRAFRVSGETTKKAAVTRALQEFIARHALLGADQVFSAGLVLQELLQGFAGPKDRVRLVESPSALAFLQSGKGGDREAAEVGDSCRRRGVPNGTMDALLIQL